jgi:ankyrin repeat protein
MGADINYVSPSGYNALIDASHSYAPSLSEEIQLFELLIKKGAPLAGISNYGESALRIASHNGKFELVQLLLDAGDEPKHLEWTPLMKAVALGTLEDVERELAQNPDVHARDWWERTAWLISLQTGDIGKAKRLLEAGANRDDCGRCGKTALMHTIINEQSEMLSWLLEQGVDPDGRDEFAGTALMMAAEQGATECVRRLLEAGARTDLDDTKNTTLREQLASVHLLENEEDAEHLDVIPLGEKAIHKATNVEIVRLLVAAGEDFDDMNREVRAVLLGLETEGEIQCSREEFLEAKYRRFGTANPQKMEFPFWTEMVKRGVNAYQARVRFEDTGNPQDAAVWCYDRFGKSITELPDGRFIEVGGEHEDYYDSNFCIYNEVFIHDGLGNFDIYGYPESVFPPTDFHSATLVGDYIYIIGRLGYPEQRRHRETPVYRLHIHTLAIEKVKTSGKNPGWISDHKAIYRLESNEIHVSGGKITTRKDYRDNPDDYVLNLNNHKWYRVNK